MRNVTYSIIIPHRDVPNLLNRLLDSIPQRNDTEIIIIDDNSSPNTVDFDHFPGIDRQDVQIVLDKKGGYGGYARNIGLNIARGKWLLFADSDDFFNYCIRDVLDEYADAREDIIFFKANSVDTDTYVEAPRSRKINRMIEQYIKDPEVGGLQLRYVCGTPWCKLIRRSVVMENDIHFEERSIHNDTAFSYLVGYYAKTIAVDRRAIYCVTEREGSVSKKISEEKKLERIENFGTSSQFFREHGILVHETRHFSQLNRCRIENKETYERGVEILLRLGFSRKEIDQGLIKAQIDSVKESVGSHMKNLIERFAPMIEVRKR